MAQVVDIALAEIKISAQNARKDLKQGTEDATLDDLAKSIQEHGLLNPITVRPRREGGYEVVAGQRRVLACRLLGQTNITAIIRTDLHDQQAMAVSLIENMQRADMAPIDKARSFSALSEHYGSITEVSKHTGISTQTIRRYTALLRLPESVSEKFTTADGTASIAVASAIATGFTNQEDMEEAWKKVEGFRASVAERVVKNSGGDLDRLEENKQLAIEGAFDVERCGSSLASCPYVPKSVRADILRIATNASN